MSATESLIALGGQVALLLWGIHMVTSGVQRALGARLPAVLRTGLKTRGRAFATGLGITTLLQSSTATAMMGSAFAAKGAVDLVPALALMLGANVGTTLIVQFVSFNVSAVFPVLILAGVVTYRRGRSAGLRDAGSALVGLGIVLLALHLLIGTMHPLEGSRALGDLLGALTADPVLNVLLAAIFAWAAHSSVAAMIFVMSLGNAGIVAPEAAFAMVLGANLGSSLNPLVANLGKDPVRLRLPAGNVLTRLVGCAVTLPFVGIISQWMLALDPSPARAAASFHLVFNLATALAFLPVLPTLANGLKRLLPTPAPGNDPGAPQYLDRSALQTPAVALANAGREVLRMADVIDEMLRASRDAFLADDPERIAAARRLDDILDRLFGSIQRYLGAIGQERLGEADTRRLADTLSLAINLEHIGDIIDRNLLDIATKRITAGVRLPRAVAEENEALYERLLEHLQLAVAVFMSGDREAAQRLVAEKEEFRAIERDAAARHFASVREGGTEAIRASSFQLDITRELKRIEAHLAATAHRLLEATGDLAPTRLRERV